MNRRTVGYWLGVAGAGVILAWFSFVLATGIRLSPWMFVWGLAMAIAGFLIRVEV